MGKSIKKRSKAIKEVLRSHLQQILADEGPCLALWGEADGTAGFAVRPGGAVLAIGDYQANLAPGEMGTLENLKRMELAQLLGGLMTPDEAPAELGHPLHPGLVRWLQGETNSFDVASEGLEGPSSPPVRTPGLR